MTQKSTCRYLKTIILIVAALSMVALPAKADTTPPVVTSISPGAWSISINTGITVSAVFSESVNPATVNSTTFTLRNVLTNGLIPATVTYNASTRTATLYPNSPLNSLLYLVNVDGGSTGVKDIAGNAMTNDYSWYFIMIPLIDLTPPTVLSVSPSAGATSVANNTVVSAQLSEEMTASSISASTFELRNSANVVIPSTVTYNSSTRMATLTPSSQLVGPVTYTATLKGGSAGVKDAAGNSMAANYVWSFTTMQSDNTPPSVSSVSPINGTTNLGINTNLSAVFSEALNATSISGSSFELRNSSNALIGATVSYNATTKTATLVPSAALAYSTAFTATIKGGSAGVKDLAGNAMTTSYSWSFTTMAAPDLTPPVVTSVSTPNASTGISVGTTISAQFSEPLNTSSITTTSFQLLSPTNQIVNATVTYDPTTRTATLVPATLLTPGTVYTATVLGGTIGVTDTAGNVMLTTYSWSFTTGASVFDPNLVPDNPAVVDQPVEVGMRFQSNLNGQITGLRFYKGVGNTGTHIGHLWTNTGTKLAEVTFTQESASGWQQVSLPTPVTIAAGVTYVVSYYSTAGIYAYSNNFFTHSYSNGALTALADGTDGPNGIYQYSSSSIFPTNTYVSTNYFVDVSFTSQIGPDVTPPTVLSVTPGGGTSGVNVNATASATFSEPLTASSVNSSSFQLRTAGGALVPATVSYNSASMMATLTPSSPFTYYAEYTATVKSGVNGVKDIAGNPLLTDYSWTFRAGDPPFISATDGPGGPILVLSNTANPFSRYAVEILRAEGLNEFAAADVSTITSTMLNNYDVIILGETTVTSSQVQLLSTWVNAGGTLVAFRPNALLCPLLGVQAASGTLNDKYLLVNTASGPGSGIVGQTIQFHGTADLHALNGATSIATLYSTASAATTYPAVTTMNVGANGGRAVSFSFDLAKSIIYTRQGNPAWAGQKRDGQIDPIRSDDLFFPDWVDFNKIAIPQADEQQRLLANIILQGNLHRKPLPRFWYLPRDLKAAVIMTGDDHGNNGTEARFNQYKTLGPNTQQDITDWKAVRATSYLYPSTPISNGSAVSFESQGFEIACHPTTGCVDYTPASLLSNFTTQLGQFTSQYPGVSAPVTNRTHCLAWSDWSSEPKTELQKGMRLDLNYYYWPQAWMQNTPGMFTGSGMPMRFADLDGSLIDVYQAPTQMTDETGMNYTTFCNAILDKAIGTEGYYGVFAANMHTDSANHTGSNAIVASAQARQIPVISAKQMLTWLDARNNSSFGNMSWSNNQLTFTVTARSNAANLKAMLPTMSGTGQLISITRNGLTVPFTSQVIKGMQYAFFPVAIGVSTYVATYGNFTTRTANQPETTQPQPVEKSTVKATAVATEAPKAQPSLNILPKLYVSALPNPSSSYFNLAVSSSDASPVTVRIVDMFGRLVEIHEKVNSTGILQLGNSWRGGTYLVEVIQGDQRKLLKLIKAN